MNNIINIVYEVYWCMNGISSMKLLMESDFFSARLPLLTIGPSDVLLWRLTNNCNDYH